MLWDPRSALLDQLETVARGMFTAVIGLLDELSEALLQAQQRGDRLARAIRRETIRTTETFGCETV
jgi:hypothetical protein